MARRSVIVWAVVAGAALFFGYVALMVVIAGGGPDSRNSADRGATGASTAQQTTPEEATTPPDASPRRGSGSPQGGEGEGTSAIEENADKGIEASGHEGKDYATAPQSGGEGGGGSGEKGLTELQRERARSAAAEFVGAAYGSSTDSEEDYYRKVYQTTASRKVAGSPGYSEIERLGETAAKSGLSSAAVLEEFRPEKVSQEGEVVEGSAAFTVGEGYNRYGEIEGKTRRYSQKLRLIQRDGAAYKVEWIGELKEEGGEGG